jgi:glycosyltransferase involved in cell wall biosynthesis
MKILIISPFLAGPDAGSGGSVLTFRQITELAKDHTLSFLSYSGVMSQAVEDQCITSLKAVCAQVETVRLVINKYHLIKANILSICLQQPLLASLCWTATMQNAVRDNIARTTPDLVWIQFPQMAQYVTLCGVVPCIMDVQDAYTLSGFRQKATMRGLDRLRALLDWVCWTSYEATYYSKFAVALTLSEQDAYVLCGMSPTSVIQTLGIPLSTGTKPVTQPSELRVGFAGSFGHQPNLEGLRWFVQEIWPLILKKLPAAKFVVAGRNPPADLLAIAQPSIEFAGFVPDILEFYSSNFVTVVPLISGGGVKIKMIEALLAGSAVVSTGIGLEGVGVTPGNDAILANDPVPFANAVVQLLLDSEKRTQIANAGSALAHTKFTAQAWRTRVNALLTKLVA